MNFEFEKEEDGKWYAILPDWPYDHEELEMVDGADELLNSLTSDNRLVLRQQNKRNLGMTSWVAL